jgi:hypothetical protein
MNRREYMGEEMLSLLVIEMLVHGGEEAENGHDGRGPLILKNVNVNL